MSSSAVTPVPPFVVGSVPVTSAARSTAAHVATPAPLRERTNWFVQEVPAYSVKDPFAAAKGSAEVIEVMAKLVEVPPVSVMFWKALVPLHVFVSPSSVEEAVPLVGVVV